MLGLEEAREALPVRRAQRRRDDQVGHVAADRLVAPGSRRSSRPRGSSRSRGRGGPSSRPRRARPRASRAGATRSRAPRPPPGAARRTGRPGCRARASSRAAARRARAARARRTPSRRRRPAGSAAGSRTRRAGRSRRAASARGKFASSGASTIHTGSPRLEHPARAAPRPARARCARSAPRTRARRRPRARCGRSAAARRRARPPRPAPSSQPSERADRLEHGGVDLDRPIRFRQDPRDRVLDALEVARVGDQSRPSAVLSDIAMTDATPTEARERLRPLRIVVADDNALLREGIASLLEDAGHEVVGRAGDADDLLLKVRSYTPDVAIVDVRMPPGNADDGLVAAAEIRRTHPTRRRARALAAPRAGVHARARRRRRVGRRLPAEGPRPRRRASSSTRSSASPPAARRSTRRWSRASSAAIAARRSTSSPTGSATVLSLLAEGRSNRAIAKQLYLSPRAVERHVQAIFQKLGLPDTRGRQPPRARRARAARPLSRRKTASRSGGSPPRVGGPLPVAQPARASGCVRTQREHRRSE